MKLKKASGLSHEDSYKTIQLKGVIDSLVEQKHEFLTSSEDSSSHDLSSQWELSPES